MTNIGRIEFNKEGHDGFIDFLKAYSIFFVVVSHCLPRVYWDKILFEVWGDMQVPMFLLVQTFHAYKKGKQPHLNLPKMASRIIIPFVFIQLMIIGILWLCFSENLPDLAIHALCFDGKGPGSYYILVYIQFAVLLPLLFPLVEKWPDKAFLSLILALSIGLEILFSLIDLPDSVYRLLCVRYLFLVYLGLVWVRQGIRINVLTISLSLISIAVILFFLKTDYDLEPWLYQTEWKFHRWICYFNVTWLLPFLLHRIYKWIQKNKWLNNIVSEIGKCSYEIFLVQMLVFAIFYQIQPSVTKMALYNTGVMMLATTGLSIVGGIFFKRLVLDKVL